MELPFYALGLLYLVVLGFYCFMAFFNIYHLVKFGFFDFTGKINGLLFSGAWLIILFFTFFFLRKVEWFEYFDFFNDIFGTVNL